MRKALRIIAAAGGMVCLVSIAILGCIYLEDTIGALKGFAKKYLARKQSGLVAGEPL